jgi:hypothetical protein
MNTGWTMLYASNNASYVHARIEYRTLQFVPLTQARKKASFKPVRWAEIVQWSSEIFGRCTEDYTGSERDVIPTGF